jgi:excisionase family DNA binding protein
MQQGWLSVEQVAERLGLHVRTVRGYIRDGRLKAVRIGKQYRIAPADLATLTGQPATEASRPQVEVSAVVEVDGIDPVAADRLSTLLVAGAQLRGDDPTPLRLRLIYDDARARLKVIILGSPAKAAEILQHIDDILTADNDMFSPADTPEARNG